MASFDAPLEAYQHHLRARHAQFVREHLDELIARSQVDPHQNQATVQEIQRTQAAFERMQSRVRLWKGVTTLLTVLFWVGLTLCGIGILLKLIEHPTPNLTSLITGAGFVAAMTFLLKQFWLRRRSMPLNHSAKNSKPAITPCSKQHGSNSARSTYSLRGTPSPTSYERPCLKSTLINPSRINNS